MSEEELKICLYHSDSSGSIKFHCNKEEITQYIPVEEFKYCPYCGKPLVKI